MFRFLICLILLCHFVHSIAAAEQPNVVLVITDDQGYGDLACHGNPVIKTPHLDQLHSESLRLSNYHVSPTCSPTRGALLTGHFTNRAGPWHTILGRSMIFEDEKIMPEAFKASGYATGMFGKWHLGDNYPFRPQDRGFTETVYHGGGGVGQTPDVWDNAYFDDRYFHNGEIKQYKGYCTDVFFDEAKRFIDESVEQKKPFFAYISTNAPHGPLLCPDKYSKPYEKLGLKKHTALFLGMITNIDDNVGRLRAYLKEKNLDKNTIFIFTTDNGTAGGTAVYRGNMRGQKGSEYDGGHRVPFFVHWPEGGLSKGRDIKKLTAHIDILPTLIEMCQLKGFGKEVIYDGKSLMPLVNQSQEPWPERTIVTDSQRVLHPIKWRKSSTMTERWRLVNGKELYDILKDPMQENDIASSHPDVVKKLRNDYTLWWNSLQPAFKKFAHIVVGHEKENPSRLTCHDWLSDKQVPPWNQMGVRRAKPSNGWWSIRVAQAGEYEITLRRWPAEAKHPIRQGLAKGKTVEGFKPYREFVGVALPIVKARLQIGKQVMEKKVEKNDIGVTFKMKLEAGVTKCQTWFSLDQQRSLGAYYVDIKKL